MSRLLRCLLALACTTLATGGAPAEGRAATNDPVYTQGLQWGLTRIGAPAAWDVAKGQGITIAIVDSGADLQHEDLKDKVAGGTSCIGAVGDPARCQGSSQDDNGHGTHVAGVAAAATDNNRGIAAVAPGARLLIVRALENDCSVNPCTASGTSGDVSAGIRWAVDHGAHVINLSLGGGEVQSTLGCSFCDAVDYAWSKGVIAVVAAGNDSDLPAGFADEPAVIVTATTRDDTRASYSSPNSGLLRAARWPVAAPGGEADAPSDCATGGTPKGIVSTYWTSGDSDQYACLAGTSMATPHVAGALAVLRSAGLSPQAAIDRLLATATDLGAPGRDDTFGYGRIDLAKAVGPAGSVTTGAPPTTKATVTTQSNSTSSTITVPATTTEPPAVPGGSAPVLSTPGTSQAAPFSPRTGGEPPGWLIVLAVGAVALSGLATTFTAWRLR